ncbi:inclusion body family protein [Burkholderia pseudomallei]|uniref:inclusion body family protein n=1 Tax=Burkholderia pseudomallei TaxID=28450 RepID=UPI00059D5F20|nr:inclusion body family protein [Burkholderia pseudomallei]ONC51451.1 hypothetical protein AQ917_06180 [Burkholderia pseudomallei]ONC55559.1 hypothetical protein AQ918_06930 [Burkholderia pseudomallei]
MSRHFTKAIFMEPSATTTPPRHRVDLLVVIDSDYVKENYPDGSRVPGTPTPVDSRALFVICAGSDIGDIQSGEAICTAAVGDVVSVTCTTIQDNSSDAGILYDIWQAVNGQVFTPFKQNFSELTGAVQPDPESESRDGLPPLRKEAHVSNFTADVKSLGNAQLGLAFGIYTLARDGQRQDPLGYYLSPVVLQVRGQRP